MEGALLLLVVGGPFLFWDALVTTPLEDHLQTAVQEFGSYIKAYLCTWTFFLFLSGVFTLEILLPANRSQRLLSTGLCHDLVLTGPTLLYWFFALPFFLTPLQMVLERYGACLRVVNLQESPVYISWPLAFLFQDLLLWVSHYLRHKIPLLWRFHALHHSQKELNLFSEFRSHPLDLVASQLLIEVPLFMLVIPTPTIVAVLISQKWFLMLLHANVRINLGILGHFFASPVFHRVHHSLEPQHTNVNFGVYLSIWDRLVGTHHALETDTQVTTGVSGYPIEQNCHWQATVGVYIRQLLYPFEKILR